MAKMEFKGKTIEIKNEPNGCRSYTVYVDGVKAKCLGSGVARTVYEVPGTKWVIKIEMGSAFQNAGERNAFKYIKMKDPKALKHVPKTKKPKQYTVRGVGTMSVNFQRKIEGETYANIPHDAEVSTKYRKLVRRMENLGLSDVHSHNVMYNEKKKRMYLVDLGLNDHM